MQHIIEHLMFIIQNSCLSFILYMVFVFGGKSSKKELLKWRLRTENSNTLTLTHTHTHNDIWLDMLGSVHNV